MNFKEKAFFLGGVLAVVFGLFLGLGGIINISDGTSEHSLGVDLIFLAVFAVLPTACGVWMCMRAKRKAALRLMDTFEDNILNLAKKYEGKLTVEEVAMNTSLTLKEARKLLDQFALDGYSELQVSETGTLVYTFPGILKAQDRQEAV